MSGRPATGPRPRETPLCAPVSPGGDVAEALLDTLEELVRRHRDLGHDRETAELHAELITSEVAHALALTCTLLRRRKR
jgi:hypothetical protein